MLTADSSIDRVSIIKQTSSAEKGLTLIELILTLAMLGFIITAVYSFYLAGLESWKRSIDHLEYHQSARIAMDKIIHEIRYAHEIFIPEDNMTMLYYRINRSGRSVLFRFRLSGDQLILEQRWDSNIHYAYNVIALGITDLEFYIDERETVFITLSAGHDNKKITIRGSTRPRNLPGEE